MMHEWRIKVKMTALFFFNYHDLCLLVWCHQCSVELVNECSHSTPLSTLTRSKHSGIVASQHDTGRPSYTYIREDLKLCTHSSPQDRPAYSTMSMLASLCALCWMRLCDGTVDRVPIARCGLYIMYRIQCYSSKKRLKMWCIYLTVKPSGMTMPAYFHMLYIPSDLWNDMSSFIIHIGCGVITISPSGLPLTP